MLLMIILVIGCLLIAEGLLLALLPDALMRVLAALSAMPVEARRLIGLVALTLGIALVWGSGVTQRL